MMLLSIKDLSIGTKQHQIVNKMSFNLENGEWLAIVGQSGSGKSMTASAIGQILPPNVSAQGKILYNGQNLLDFSPADMRKMRGKKMAFIFQDYQSSFNPFLTIGRHFDEYQRTHESKSKKERVQQAKAALISVGLPDAFYSRYPSQLSGGQLQRVSIALALLFQPDILIADEPTTALDSMTAASVLNLLADLKEKANCTVLFITHDLRHVRQYADRVLVMLDGAVVESGTKEQICNRPVHPYTKKLLSATPSLRKSHIQLVPERQESVMIT